MMTIEMKAHQDCAFGEGIVEGVCEAGEELSTEVSGSIGVV